jgi:ribose/xylose/arabinose/galactoside ABC-type transport system permease subunit
MDSIAAAVLGGTNLFGGIGDLWGGLAGVFIISILSTMLNLNNVSAFYQWVIKGAILIGALAVEFFESRSQ